LKNLIVIVLLILFFVSSALFFAQNDALVTLNYFSGDFEWQLNWIMILCLAVGFLLGFFSLVFNLMKARLQLRQTKKKLANYEKEVKSLRELPIKDSF
jgi:putative membrane protein